MLSIIKFKIFPIILVATVLCGHGYTVDIPEKLEKSVVAIGLEVYEIKDSFTGKTEKINKVLRYLSFPLKLIACFIPILGIFIRSYLMYNGKENNDAEEYLLWVVGMVLSLGWLLPSYILLTL